jgi:hypothetical protein
MQSEIAKGENPAVTNFVGASAAPSHTPAARPQMTPSLWSEKAFFVCTASPAVGLAFQSSIFPGKEDQRKNASRVIPSESATAGIQNWISVNIALIVSGRVISLGIEYFLGSAEFITVALTSKQS